MFFELRTYDLKPAKAPVYLQFFRTYGLSRVTSHLPMMGYWLVETGRLNRIEHLWAYSSFEERDACRAELMKNSEWTTQFVPEAFVDIVAQENRLLTLEKSSAAFDRAVATRKQQHPDQTSDTPMFASTLQGLSHGSAFSEAGELIAGFRVLSGAEPGSYVSLNAGNLDDLLQAQSGVVSHEILRPLSLSPLQ